MAAGRRGLKLVLQGMINCRDLFRSSATPVHVAAGQWQGISSQPAESVIAIVLVATGRYNADSLPAWVQGMVEAFLAYI